MVTDARLNNKSLKRSDASYKIRRPHIPVAHSVQTTLSQLQGSRAMRIQKQVSP